MGFGGNNGLTDFKTLLGFTVQDPGTRLALYAISVLALGAAFLLCRFITTSKLGRVLLALRDAESRVRFLGYSVTHAKLFVFTVSAVLAGFAGALYVPQVGIINPSEFSPRQLDRDRHLGRGRRPLHADRRHSRSRSSSMPARATSPARRRISGSSCSAASSSW